jgi:hypothetical protein
VKGLGNHTLLACTGHSIQMYSVHSEPDVQAGTRWYQRLPASCTCFQMSSCTITTKKSLVVLNYVVTQGFADDHTLLLAVVVSRTNSSAAVSEAACLLHLQMSPCRLIGKGCPALSLMSVSAKSLGCNQYITPFVTSLVQECPKTYWRLPACST